MRLVGPSAPATKRRRPSSFSAATARLAREPRAFAVELVDDRLEAVVGLGDRGGREGVGLDDVGAGAEIVQVDVADRVGLGQDEQVVVALEVLAVVAEALAAEVGLRQLERLDLGPHGAVEHQDALCGGFARRPAMPSPTDRTTEGGSKSASRFCRSTRRRTEAMARAPRSGRCTSPAAGCAASRADGRSRRPGRRGSWCRSGSRSRRGRRGRAPARPPPRRRSAGGSRDRCRAPRSGAPATPGSLAPARAAKFAACLKFCTGRMPGTIGMSMPRARTRSR